MIDWRESPAHLKLLCRFLVPTSHTYAEGLCGWDAALGATPQLVIRDFAFDGVLRSPTAAELLEHCFTADDLRSLLRLAHAKVSGRKADLIERLSGLDNVRDLIDAAPSRTLVQYGNDRLICSDAARPHVVAYRDRRRHERRQAILATWALLDGDMFDAALDVRERFRSSEPPLGADYDGVEDELDRSGEIERAAETQNLGELRAAHPRILADLTNEDLRTTQNVAMAMHLWGPEAFEVCVPSSAPIGVPRWQLMFSPTRPSINSGLRTAVRMVEAFVRNQQDLADLRATVGRDYSWSTTANRQLLDRFQVRTSPVLALRVEPGGAPCEPCEALVGKAYEWGEIPELPHAGCVGERGCQCRYAAHDAP